MFEKYSNSFLKDFDINKILSKINKKFISLGQSTLVYAEDDPVKNIYFILSGKVDIRKLINEKNESLGFMGPGELIGVEDALTCVHYSKSVFTLQQTDLISVRKNDFLILIELDDNFRLWILKYLSLRIRSRS
ncbi:MAG: cyclic nucleotide-binding domain-containing protein [bacterium]